MPMLLLWRVRHFVWSSWLSLRQGINSPQTYGPPKIDPKLIEMLTMREQFGDQIPLDIPVFKSLPSDENRLGVHFVHFVTLNLNKIFPAMQRGLPQIDEDIHAALDRTITKNYRSQFSFPRMPEVYEGPGSPSLEALARESPYAIFLERMPDGEGYCFDMTHFGDIPHRDDMYNISTRVVFSEDLCALHIESKELGVATPGGDEEKWELAKKLAICALTTHAGLTRHFHYAHLILNFASAVSARNLLPSAHPIFRLIWPSIYNALYTNFGVTEVQMLPDGDYANMYSFEHQGLMELYAKMHGRYRLSVCDPRRDAKVRGITGDAVDRLGLKTEANLKEFFDVIHAHASRYVRAYYKSDAEIQEDTQLTEWLDEYGKLIPNGLGEFVPDGEYTVENVTDLVAGIISEGIVVHDMVGTTLWDYQLWVDRNPTCVRKDGKRIPLDMLHRIVMNNYGLQLRRAKLLDNYSVVADDEKGKQLFTQFEKECQDLQNKYDAVPADLWRMEPKNMEIGMNG